MLDVTIVKGKQVTEFCIPGTWEDAVKIINGNSKIKVGQVNPIMRYLQLNNAMISEPDEDEENEFPVFNLTIQQVLDM